MKSQQMIYTQVPNTTDGRCTFASVPCGPHKTSHLKIQRGKKKKTRLQFGHGEIFRREEIIRWVAHVPGNHLSNFTRVENGNLSKRWRRGRACGTTGLGRWKANGEEKKKAFTKQTAFREEGLAHAHTHGFSVQVESLFAGGSEKSLSEQGLGRVVGQLEVMGARVDRREGAVRGVHLAHHGEPWVEVGEAAGR